MESHDNEYYEVLKRQNKVLRRVNGILRKALSNSREYSDILFLELCDESTFEDTETFDVQKLLTMVDYRS